MSKHDNILLLTDSYKVGHWPQYPEGTTEVYSYFESRGGAYPSTVFFGLQYIIEKYLTRPFTFDDIEEADALYRAHFGTENLFNYNGWYNMLSKHGGRLPVRIKAVPEGSVVPVSNVLMTVENTDPEFPWLTNWLETLLSQVWYPTTVATVSWHVRQYILSQLERSGTPEAINFKLHDFGFRGVSSVESAGIGGAAHLTSFMGTDTVPALTFLQDYYYADMAGFSVPASEHSTMTSWGKDHEVDAYRNMIVKYHDMPIVSVVSDSYDIFTACRDLWGGVLKDEVLGMEGTLVVRPDSGDPPVVVIELLEILGEKFGWERNEKDYKVLNPKVRLIWGDGLEPNTIQSILFRMNLQQWSADNIVFGMGGGLLQKVNRDTQKFAFKCSSVIVNGEERDVFKTPVGDSTKNSKRGRLALIQNPAWFDQLITVSAKDPAIEAGDFEDLLQVVYENGFAFNKTTLNEVRRRTGVLPPVEAVTLS